MATESTAQLQASSEADVLRCQHHSSRVPDQCWLGVVVRLPALAVQLCPAQALQSEQLHLERC